MTAIILAQSELGSVVKPKLKESAEYKSAVNQIAANQAIRDGMAWVLLPANRESAVALLAAVF